ncbi:MAG: BatD family protein, partial [Nitrospirae bacterium]|nr:BatD family protein [Nitrospirota bacterium]
MVIPKTSVRMGILLWVVALCASPAWGGSVTAFVDRNSIQEGESFRLTVKESGMSLGTSPDLSPLEKYFEVLGTSQSTRTSMINGQTNSATEWITMLIPKRVGRITIPAIQVGDEQSAPLTITVRPAGQPGKAGGLQDVFLESHVTPKNPYVQSQ